MNTTAQVPREAPTPVRWPRGTEHVRDWYRKLSDSTGRSVNALLVEALTEYRERHGQVAA